MAPIVGSWISKLGKEVKKGIEGCCVSKAVRWFVRFSCHVSGQGYGVIRGRNEGIWFVLFCSMCEEDRQFEHGHYSSLSNFHLVHHLRRLLLLWPRILSTDEVAGRSLAGFRWCEVVAKLAVDFRLTLTNVGPAT